jgi:hypothetical protein
LMVLSLAERVWTLSRLPQLLDISCWLPAFLY